MTDDERAQVIARVPPSLRKRLNAHPETMNDLIERGIHMALGDDDLLDLRAEYRELDADVVALDEEIERLQAKRERVAQERDAVAERIAAAEERHGEYDRVLDDLLDRLVDSPRASLPRIIENDEDALAQTTSVDQMVEDALERAIAQGRDLTTASFTPPEGRSWPERLQAAESLSNFEGFGDGLDEAAAPTPATSTTPVEAGAGDDHQLVTADGGRGALDRTTPEESTNADDASTDDGGAR